MMRGEGQRKRRSQSPSLGKDPKRARKWWKWWERVGCSEAEWPKLSSGRGWKKWWLGKIIRLGLRLWPQPRVSCLGRA